MATQEQILQALKKADAAGNVEDAKKLARMYKDGQQSRPEINNVVEGVRQFSQGATFQSADEIEAAVKTLAKDKAISQFGLAAGFAQSPENSMGLAGALRTDTQANDYSTSGYKQERDKLRAQNKEFVRQNPKTAMALEVLGGITTPVLGTAKAASTLGKTALGSAQGAGYGALYGLGSADEMSDVTSDALTQGAVGGLIGGTLSRLGAAVAPKLQQGANELQRKGINLTPGQAFGGVTDTLEQKLGSTLPFINTRRTENIKRWNQSIIDDVIKPIGGKMSAVSDDITSNVRTAQKTLSTAYDDLLPNISLKMDKPFKDEMTEILTKASQDLTEPVQKKLSNELSRIGQQLNVSKSGQTLKGIQSDLGRKIAKYSTSTNSDDKFMGEALEDILDGMMNSMERQNPKYAGQLKKINTAYAKLIRAEGAAAKLNGAEAFTPKQFGQAVRQSDRSARKRAVAAGNALSQDVAEQGQILGSKIPDSGTSGNLVAASGLLGGSAIAGFVTPSMLLIPGLTTMLYTKTGQNLFNKYIQSGGTRQGVRDFVQKYAGAGASGLLTTQE